MNPPPPLPSRETRHGAPSTSASSPITGITHTHATAVPTTPPATVTASPKNSSTANTSLFRRNPSIRIKKEKSDKESKKTKEGKEGLKRSRSPIKLIKNIKSYLHVHKHKYSISSSGSGTASQGFVGGLAPPRSSMDGGSGQHYRSASLPSSSILSAGSQLCAPEPQSGLAPRERQRSGNSLDPEQQVLLLRVMSYFEHAGHRADEETAEYLLSSYQWDIDQTLLYSQDLVQAVEGTLLPVQGEAFLSGAVNDQMTSCYIDALLFAMFARLSAFEGLLNVNLDAESDSDSDVSGDATEQKRDEERQENLLHTHRLQTWLRMFVNQLRSGKLVQAHVVKELRQHLYSCGWHCPGPMDPPGSSRQEDSSELFMFLTEKLHLPYLPLEQRLLHGARVSADDDKVITERMLQISIPTPEPGHSKSPSLTSSLSFSLIDPAGQGSSMNEILSLEQLLAQHFYDNTLTGIRRLVSSGTGAPLSPGVEVPVSAWQVLELLPFYSSTNEQGGIIHASQSQYPADVVILPLILKRYSFGADGRARRIGTPIDIPRRIDFSRFVNPQTTESKLDSKTAVTATGSVQNLATSTSGSTAPVFASSASASSLSPLSAQFSSEPDQLLDVTSNKDDRSTAGASSAAQSFSAMKINTQVSPSNRKYSMSLLQAAESPRTPVTPPPQYSPSKQFPDASDDKRGWSPSPLDTNGTSDYLDCQQPKVKYMLELKSVVCHVGSRLDSGHYRSYVADVVGSTPSPARSVHPLAFQEPRWLKHDDLDPSGQRVHTIERDSAQSMDMESDWARNGYILFYELQTIVM
ncbi:hypothetical protein EMPS_01432 [Entomortierella parvispora]|uniref:ubiquitinyl hydrolase 1 n=1 Tax=Entomortierella parvispora TaxID=205924 RepID=A0A9P3LSJ1_9FUNG|nr:hypothetical protein EMPS_01432 [Entomortierella parvispora]